MYIDYTLTASFQIPSTSSFIDYPTIQRYIVQILRALQSNQQTSFKIRKIVMNITGETITWLTNYGNISSIFSFL
jgi:hypothetical protein